MFKKVFIALCLSLALLGCKHQDAYKVHKETVENQSPKEIAQNLLDQQNANITAAARTVLTRYHSGIYTKDEKEAYSSRLEKFAKDVDTAQDLLDKGNVILAQDKIKLLETALDLLEKELVESKQGG